jgi:L-2-hydroxyglutarate oxidase LhgO
MESLERDISEGNSGSVVCGTSVVRVDPAKDGWVVQMSTASQEEGDADSVMAKTLINSSGLSGPFILNSLRSLLRPPVKPMPIWYAKGSYASYHGPGVSDVKHLIYPVPETGTKQHGFSGLGTHLTLDLGGNIKFGPDIEWIEPNIRYSAIQDSAMVSSEEAVDFWMSHLVASADRLPSMFTSVQQYLPGISSEGFQPDYVGIRPKLGPPGSGFQDFVFMKERSGEYMGGSISSDKGGVMLNLLGIESPGLTSSLAIAELVESELLPKK